MMRDPTRQQQRSTIGSAWTKPPLPRFSPELAPSDFHFFPTLKRTLDGRRLTTNEDVEAAVRTQDTEFYQQGFFKLMKRWDKCINVGGDYVEKWPTNVPFRPHRYLVHAVSCRWRTWETYFPTIPPKIVMFKLLFKEF
jgi:hypothetical protein